MLWRRTVWIEFLLDGDSISSSSLGGTVSVKNERGRPLAVSSARGGVFILLASWKRKNVSVWRPELDLQEHTPPGNWPLTQLTCTVRMSAWVSQIPYMF